ncbi:hypothetical protein DSLASN_08050 [Desulfoluna limicola]|uniref:Uncharacterized protein n=1 Tax=Desulfoluna limicola TaxID=2810562 RepID=A0ABN6F094_9BACT|nr:hypothetical protein [Desulfoluna limicola]BCS95173.1 hypothetical protein DSLASN_08050 [Desulfoluna limicola]
MKTFRLLVVSILLLSSPCLAQISAITDTGQEVVLYDDHTWAYVGVNHAASDVIKLDTLHVTKPDNASFLVKGIKVKYGMWMDPKKWALEKQGPNDDSEYMFTLRGEDAYAMIISEQIRIPIKTLKKVAVENARSVAPDIRVIKEGDRVVNGVTVSYMEMGGTIQGIPFTYLGNYYSGKTGSVQVIGYTSQDLVEKYRANIDELINGFTILEQQ